MSMKLKRFVVTAVDFDTDGRCDGKAQILTILASKENAQNYVLEDMREYVDMHANEGMVLDEAKMRVADDSCLNGCEWKIEEVYIQLDSNDVIDLCNEAYNQGYSDGAAETEAACEELR